MKKAGQPEEYMDGDKFEAYVKSQVETMRKLLADNGLLKK